jgi:hypothetical protein
VADVYTYVTNTGTIVPDTQDILNDVAQEFRDAFGQDLITTPDTPQGVLIVAETLARAAVADNNAVVANQINPNLAGGVFLDALLALTGSARLTDTSTVVSCTLTGVQGTIIPMGVLAQDTNSNQYASQVQAVIGSGGTVTVNFAAVLPGPITVAAGALSSIVTGVLGWETITNPAAQTSIGTLTQSDGEAQIFRRQTLFSQGTSLAGAIVAGLHHTPGVTSLSFRENDADTSTVIDGVTLLPHSIYTCVNGGSDIDVATTLTNKKSGGCNYTNGASATPISQPVTVPFSGQVINVLFDRPDIIGILVQVTVITNKSVQDPVGDTQQAILNYAAGMVTDLAGLGVGVPVSPFELAAAIGLSVPGIFVKNLLISYAVSPSFGAAELPINIWQIAQILQSNIAVTVVTS